MSAPPTRLTLEELAQRALCFGDVVLLKKQDGKSGFVSAQERTTPQVRLEELESGDCPPDTLDCQFQITPKSQYTQKQVFLLQLIRNGLSEDYLSDLESMDVDGVEGDPFPTVTSRSIKTRLMKYLQAYNREKEVNNEELKLVAGESVLYGQVIQLRHVSSGRYVTIKKTAADVERGALKVVLEDGGAEGSWFKIFSGYRTKPEGGKVVPGEVIALRSLAFSGNGLHLSIAQVTAPTMLPVNGLVNVSATLEISASPEVSALKIIPFSAHIKAQGAAEEQLRQDALCGHDCVSIQDLVANTVYINALGADGDKQLYFESPLGRADPTAQSGNDVWRLEPVSVEWAGMQLSHNIKVRIRHLATSTYLAALGSKAKASTAHDKAAKAEVKKAARCSPQRVAAVGQAKAPTSPSRMALLVTAAIAHKADLDSAADLSGELSMPGSPRVSATSIPAGAPALPSASSRSLAESDIIASKDMQLRLTQRYYHPDTVWVLQQFNKDESHVGGRTYAYLCHETSGFWLSGAGPHIEQVAAPKDGTANVPGIEEQRCERVHPVLHPLQLERNVMLVNQVDEEYTTQIMELRRRLLILNFLANSLSDITSASSPAVKLPSDEVLVRQIKKSAAAASKVHDEVLNGSLPVLLRQWVKPACRALRNVKKMMDESAGDAAGSYRILARELGVLKAVVRLLTQLRVRTVATLPSLRSTMLGRDVQQLCDNCHMVLKVACTECEPNQAFVAASAPLIMSQLDCSDVAADTLAAIYEDNMAQMQTVTQDIIRASVNLIRQDGSPRFVPRYANFLKEICGTRERPMPNNQNWLVAEILGVTGSAVSGDAQPPVPTQVFFQAMVCSMPDECFQPEHTWCLTVLHGDGEPPTTINCCKFKRLPEDATTASIHKWLVHPLEGGETAAEQKEHKERELFKYYCCSLQLICALCAGRNSLVVKRILEVSQKAKLGLEFDALHTAVANKNLPYVLRSILLQTITALYVDVDPYTALKLPHNIRMLSSTSITAAGSANAPIAATASVDDAGDATTDLESEVTAVGRRRAAIPPTINTLISSTVAALNNVLQEGTVVTSVVSDEGEWWKQPSGSGRFGEADGDADGGPEDIGAETVGRNSFVLHLLKLLREMFRLGMLQLRSGTTSAVLGVLLQLLGQLDSLPLDDPRRFESKPSNKEINKVVMEAKKVILQIMEFALDMQSEEQCYAVFQAFTRWQRCDQMKMWWAKKLSKANNGDRTLEFLSNGQDPRAKATLLSEAAERPNFIADRSMGADLADGPDNASQSCDRNVSTSQWGTAGQWQLDIPPNEEMEICEPRYSDGDLLSGEPIHEDANHSAGQRPVGGVPIAEGIESRVHPFSEAQSANDADVDTGLTSFVEEASQSLRLTSWAQEEEGEGTGLETPSALFTTDVLNDHTPPHLQETSPVMQLLGLVRYEDTGLTGKSFQLMERLLSKREKLIASLLQTFVVTDDDLIMLSQWAGRQLEVALQQYNYMGSLDLAERATACTKAAAALKSLTQLLQPNSKVKVSERKGGPITEVHISKITASNCQTLLHDMQGHNVALKFLKLPLTRTAPSGPSALSEAQDSLRLEVFANALVFLRHFMVVGEAAGGVSTPSRVNQDVLLPYLPLLTSFLDVAGLPASDTIAALFIKNYVNAQREGPALLDRMVKLIVQCGGQRNARWLTLLGRIMVVEGEPVKKNQTTVMQLASQYEAEFLHFLTDLEGLAHLSRLMASNELSTTSTQGSELAYHVACVQLLADCCIGAEAELIVKASGYLSLSQIVDVLLLPTLSDTKSSTRRCVARAYWALLQQCYFMADTEDTRRQVRDRSNRMWPDNSPPGGVSRALAAQTPKAPPIKETMQRFMGLPPLESAHAEAAANSVIELVLSELELAISEPKDALSNLDSATSFLARSIFPALQVYLERHFASFHNKLVAGTPLKLAVGEASVCLKARLLAFKKFVKVELVGGNMGAASKAEAKMVKTNLRALLEVLERHIANPDDAQQGAIIYAKSSNPAPSSQQTGVSVIMQKKIQLDWLVFLKQLAQKENVHMDAATNSVVEVVCFPDGRQYRHASLLRMARLLTAPSGCTVPTCQPAMNFEQALERMGRLMKNRKVVDVWQEDVLVKMVSCLRACYEADDGRASYQSWHDAWRRMGYFVQEGAKKSELEKPEPVNEQIVAWKQEKYMPLHACEAAIKMMAQPSIELQFEGLQLLLGLLENANKSVQDKVHELLNTSEADAQAVFNNMHAAFTRCKKYIARKSYDRKVKIKTAKHDMMQEQLENVKQAFWKTLNFGAWFTKWLARHAHKAATTAATAAATGMKGAAQGAIGAAQLAATQAELAARNAASNADRLGRSVKGGVMDAGKSAMSKGSSLLQMRGTNEDKSADLHRQGGPATSTLAAASSSTAESSVMHKSTSVNFARDPVVDSQQSPNVEGAAVARNSSGAQSSRLAVRTVGPQPIGEGMEGQEGEQEDDEEEEEEEQQHTERKSHLNNASDAFAFTKLLLQVLQYMCEGHHTRLQHLLQQQPKAAVSVDFIVESVDLMNVLQDHAGAALLAMDVQVPELMTRVCALLQEMMQGPCYSNQQAVANTNFLASCNRVFGNVEYDINRAGLQKEMEKLKSDIKRGLLEVLFSLLEGSPDEVIPKRCSDILDFNTFDRQILRICRVLGHNPQYPALYNDRVELDFDEDQDERLIETLTQELLKFTGFLLRLGNANPSRPTPLPYLADLYCAPRDAEIDDDLPLEQAAVAAGLRQLLKSKLGYVEIQWNGMVEPTYFMMTPQCAELENSDVWRKQTLERLQTTVSPDSRGFPAVKAAELTDVLRGVVDDIELNSQMSKIPLGWILNSIAKYRTLYLESSFYLAVIALLIQLMSDVMWTPRQPWSVRGENWRIVLLTLVIGIQFFLTALMAFTFLYTDLYKHVKNNQLQVELDHIGGSKDDNNSKDVIVVGGISLNRPPYIKQGRWYNKLASGLITILTTFLYLKFWYVVVLVAASMSAFAFSPFALVIHFSIYLTDFDSGRTLVEAMTRSGVNILNTFLLAVLAIYVCAVITFLAFRDPMAEANETNPPPCDTFYQCLGAHFSAGIHGDIASIFTDPATTMQREVHLAPKLQARSLFVLIFFMLWTFVLGNIFIGVISSAFEAIREDQKTISTDCQSKCLMCSLDMYTLDAHVAGGFELHIQADHNPLQYVYFLHHLRETDPEMYTGAESAVAVAILNNKTSTAKGTWLPVNKSLSYKQALDSEKIEK